MYAQVKPVKMDSAGNKPSQKSKNLAEGPKPLEPVAARNNSWTQSFLTAVMKTVGGSTDSTARNLPPDKVRELCGGND